MREKFRELVKRKNRIFANLELIQWDLETKTPIKSKPYLAELVGELSMQEYDLFTSDEFINLVESLNKEKNNLTEIEKKEIELNSSINEDLMKTLLEEISGKIPDKVKEPSYNIDGNKLLIYPGMEGNEVNKLSLREQIVSLMKDTNKIKEEDLKITIPINIIKPHNIDIEKIYSEIYEKPENATYNEQTKELKLDKDGLDFAITMEEAKNILKENKDEYIIPLKKIKAEITYDKLGKDIFPDLLRNISNKL